MLNGTKNCERKTDEMIIALWEKVIEGRPEEADRLQAIRNQIKAKYPKQISQR